MKNGRLLFIEEKLKSDSNNPILYYEMGRCLEKENAKQAYLCYENARFYSKDTDFIEDLDILLDEMRSRGEYAEPCSIVILSYNLADITRDCINSIRETTPTSAREIVVVDNNSEDGSVEYLKDQSDIVLIANDFNAGFPGGCNIGINASRKENDIWLLNNDTILCDNSLFWLRMALYEKEEFGAVGSVTNHSGNGQAVIADKLTIDEYIDFSKKTNIPMDNPYEYRVFLIGFSVLIKRKVLEKTGYLDEYFSPGHYEDNDLGIRILNAGYNNVLVRNAFLIHLGSKSFKKSEIDYSGILDTNLEKFVSKYKAQHFYNFDFDSGLREVVGEEYLGTLDEGANFLEINCRMGGEFGRMKYKYPNVNFYGIESNERKADVSLENLMGCSIEYYEKITDDPFAGVLFDIISIDSSTIDRNDIKEYLEYAEKHLAKEGRVVVKTLNKKYFKVWLPIITAGDLSGLNGKIFSDEVSEKVEGTGLNIKRWVMGYRPPRDDFDVKAVDAIQNILPENERDSLVIFTVNLEMVK